MNEILEKYQVRKSNKEKTKFIEYLKNRLAKSGYSNDDIQIEERWKGILKTRNIVVGNPETANVIVTAHYDTCALSPFPNFMFPTNIPMFLLSQTLITFFMFFIAWCVMVPFALFVENPVVSIYAFEFTLIAFVVQLAFGFKNKHTANDNTSGVITLIKILENLPKEQRNKICVVFFDNEEKGLFGSLYFSKKHKDIKDKKMLINIDCVGDGENIVFLPKRNIKKSLEYSLLNNILKNKQENFNVEYKNKTLLPMMFPSDQAYFKKGIAVCALKKGIFGLYAGRIHTPFDTKCREENINYLSESINEYIKEIYCKEV